MFYLFEATGTSIATGLETTIRIKAALADGDRFESETLNHELALSIAENDARTYLNGDIVLTFIGAETEQTS